MGERELAASPSMGALFARAGLAMVPGAAHLPFVGGGGGEVPDETLTLADVAVDRRRLIDYDRVCGFPIGDVLPATYPHMLAFPLQLALMTAGHFPVAAIGLVHVHNRIVSHRPIDAGERLSLRVWAEPMAPHPRGRTFVVRSEVGVGDELVWEEASTNLARGHRDDSIAQPQGPPDTEGLPATATWRLPGDLGRRYGSVSGDRNPIHVHPLSARLLGFPTAIAHGMWTLARCLAALGPRPSGPGRHPYAVEVAFRRPILLPASVDFAEARTPDGIAFGVRDAGRGTAHLDGLVTPSGR